MSFMRVECDRDTSIHPCMLLMASIAFVNIPTANGHTFRRVREQDVADCGKRVVFDSRLLIHLLCMDIYLMSYQRSDHFILCNGGMCLLGGEIRGTRDCP